MKIGQIVSPSVYNNNHSSNIRTNNFNTITIKNPIDKPISNAASSINNRNYFVSFGAISVNQALNSDSKLYDKYKLEGQPDILEFLENNPTTPTSAYKFLCHATADQDNSQKVAEEFSKNPREAENIKNRLIKILGGGKDGNDLFMTWFHDENNGYRKAYSDYYYNQVWQKAGNLTDLLKQSPNVAPWALQSKAKELGQDFVFGELPEDFENYQTYKDLIAGIKNSDFQKAYIEAKDAELKADTEDNWSSVDYTNKKMQELTKPFQVKAGNSSYTVKPIIQSFSAKNIYFITPDKENAKTYIVKFDPYEVEGKTDKARKLAESAAIRPDMPYLDAMIDFYLKENNSPNAADIKFYDYDTKSVLYGMTNGSEPTIPEEYSNNLYSFGNYEKVSDLKKLGVELSDVHAGNFKVDENDNYILIDSGHVRFQNTFRPPVIGKHITLGNLCGRELCK